VLICRPNEKLCSKLQYILGACNQKNPPLLKGRWREAPEGLGKAGKTTPPAARAPATPPYCEGGEIGKPAAGRWELQVKAALFVFILFVSDGAFAETNLTAKVTPPSASIGDRLKYEITIKSDEKITPLLRLENRAPFEVMGVKSFDEKEGVRKVVFTLASFKTGMFRLPVYTLNWMGEDGEPRMAQTEPLLVEIRSVLKPGQTEPESFLIEPAAEAKPDWKSYVLPMILLICFLSLVAAFLYYLKKRKKVAGTEKPLRGLTPSEAAMERLKRIEEENLYAKGNIKLYFSEISDALRDYLKEEFSVDAPEKTTCELRRIWPAKLDGSKFAVILLLEICDSAKFAKAVPPPEEAAKSLREAKNFVRSFATTGDCRTRTAEFVFCFPWMVIYQSYLL